MMMMVMMVVEVSSLIFRIMLFSNISFCIQSDSDAPWIFDNVMDSGNINGSDALTSFEKWLTMQTKFDIPPADHYMTFTRYETHSLINEGRKEVFYLTTNLVTGYMASDIW